MTHVENFPIYVVLEMESRDVLVAAEEVSGFFCEPTEQSPEVVFWGIHEVEEGKRRVEDAVLEVMNFRQRKIGEYFIGRTVLGDVSPEVGEGRGASVSYRFFGNRCEYSEAAKIWKHWATVAALRRGGWVRRSESCQEAWLHVVQNSWFASGRRAARYGVDDVVYLDGTQINTKSGFYCALGEAANGPRGYFGSNLDALADCISSEYGEGPLAEIVWKDFRVSQGLLGDNFLDSVMDLMREFRVSISIR